MCFEWKRSKRISSTGLMSRSRRCRGLIPFWEGGLSSRQAALGTLPSLWCLYGLFPSVSLSWSWWQLSTPSLHYGNANGLPVTQLQCCLPGFWERAEIPVGIWCTHYLSSPIKNEIWTVPPFWEILSPGLESRIAGKSWASDRSVRFPARDFWSALNRPFPSTHLAHVQTDF